MATLHNAKLTIEPVEGEETQRVAAITYELDVDADERLAGQIVDERIRLHAVDEHDAAMPPDVWIVVERTASYTADAGSNRRAIRVVLDRSALDVQRDWWLAGSAGETRGVAEWPDHVAADIVVSRFGIQIARTTTPTVTGSWGVLGAEHRRRR